MNPSRQPRSSILCFFRAVAFQVFFPLVCHSAAAAEIYQPKIAPADFTHVVNHPFFPLVPGTTSVFSEQEGRDKRENTITVTRKTRMIMGVKCMEVHDTVARDGVLLEDSSEWYAQDKQGNVWFFGEATREFKSGGRVKDGGSWEAGVGGAQPGIVMPGRPSPGNRYRQEYLAGVAEDIGRTDALGETVTVPAGSYKECVRTAEWSMLESGTSKKWYAKGVGLVRAESTDGEVSILLSITKK